MFKWQKYGVPTPGATTSPDHSPLFILLSTKDVLAWELYSMEYKPGRDNMTANCLSRLPLPAADYSQNQEPQMVAVLSPEIAALTME